jgi:glucosamine--fructose-6-phosphate aminotransferase (isomerizing)
MCGIVGYTGERQAVGVLLDGLAQLEYRGYDSTGICLAGADGFTRVRADANLAALRTLVDATTDTPAPAGIGHTRWATHGEVSVPNTHPFVGCDTGFAVVLNGIVENFTELRDELAGRGHRFESSTDAEVVVHLLEEHAHLEPADAMARVSAHLDGHFAIVALDRRRPGVLIGTRRQVPLVAGIGEGEHFLASTVDAVLAQTRRFVLLEDGDVIVLDGSEWSAHDTDGRVVDREEITVVRSTTRADHEGHGSFLAKEIVEQPGAVADTLLGRIAGDRVHLGELDDRPGDTVDLSFTDRVAGLEHLVIVGCGTALHAGQVARPMFERWSSLRTEVAVASEWRYAAPIVDASTLVVAVSQSGETADTLAAVRLARSLGAATIGITNMPDSQLTREVDRSLLTRAGLEMSVAATKTFTTQVALLSLLAFELGNLRDTLGGAAAEQALVELELIPEKMAELLRRPSPVEAIAESIARAPFVVFLGRQSGVPAALEGALKLREIAYLPAEVHAAGELKHGSIALMEVGTPVVAVVTDAMEPERTISNLHEVRARGARVIAVATEGNTRIAAAADEVIWVPATDPMLEPMLAVIPLQQLALHAASCLGLNVDQPRNLAKTVTVE